MEHFGNLHEIMNKGVGIKEGEAKCTAGPWLTFDPKSELHVGQHAEAANALLKDPNNKGYEIPSLESV